MSRVALRRFLPPLLLIAPVVGALYFARGTRLEPADFVFNNGTEVATLDPATVTGVPEGRVIKAIFEGLTVKDPKTSAPLPGMAERWAMSEDGLHYTFHIRQGARWSNGDEVTAHDFVYSWKRFLAPETAAEYAYQLWYVKGAKAYTTTPNEAGRASLDFSTVGIRASGDYTLEVELNSPTPFFIDLMGFYPLFPVNRRNIEEAQAKWPGNWQVEWLKPANLVTNGPYRVQFRRINDRIRLVKSDSYWDAENVAFNTIDVLAVENYNTGLNLYLSGSCHWIDRIPSIHTETLLKREDFEPTAYLGTYFYRINVTEPPMDDRRVRQALSLTIPRKLIVENITKAGQTPAYGLMPPGLPSYRGAQCDPEDTARAKALLAEAGYGPGGKPFPRIEIHYNVSEEHRDIAEYISSIWQRELGIDAGLKQEEWKVYQDTQRVLGYQVSRSAWIGDYPDPNTFLDMFVTGGENNRTGWGDPRYDRLIADAGKELDLEKRLGYFREAEAILMTELPIIPIYYYVSRNMVSPRLGGFYHNLQDEHFPKFFYWLSDEELAEKRKHLPPHKHIVDAADPSSGEEH